MSYLTESSGLYFTQVPLALKYKLKYNGSCDGFSIIDEQHRSAFVTNAFKFLGPT